ncbi:uncharacterized protein LOC134539871 [Bacillus rossius redtenbacheri]|uniref:uncharacterized protein LOC134539871 n=1 Tax=Bacillus rossius redtenbacheri TaxID=93214 RepID=UPI002FDCB502
MQHEEPEAGPSASPLLHRPRVTVVVDRSPGRWQPCRWGVSDDDGSRGSSSAARPQFRVAYERQQSTASARDNRRRSSSLKGPLRALRLCVLSVLLPGALVAVPLYMRYHVYGETAYPVGVSDMRLVDARVSTTWCQRQVVRANTTFNAFLLAGQPAAGRDLQRLSMSREIADLQDDMKEYWAFYLIRGSSVTVSSCCRWPGASLIVLRGHKNLHECAYIGDASSEESDEVGPAGAEGAEGADPARPETVRRARQGVVLHDQRRPLQREEMVDGELDEEADSVLAQYLRSHAPARRRAAPAAAAATPRSSRQPPAASSDEVFDKVLRELQRLGARGRRVLRRLGERLKTPVGDGAAEEEREAIRRRIAGLLGDDHDGRVAEAETPPPPPPPPPPRARRKGGNKAGRRPQAQTRGTIDGRNSSADQGGRARRDVYVVPVGLPRELFMHDEDADAAMEEGLTPDGIADHHVTLNETTLNDSSHSEFWSSFSSSEERLLNCSGLIVNLPLSPHPECRKGGPDFQRASHPNTVTYRVPVNGYYFFIFNSENEVQSNFIHVNFRLEKVMYDVSNPLASCRNASGECALPLDFFSDEKVVLELPLTSDDSAWNQEFVVVTTCEPRTAVYLVCVISVPLLIILFAFQ